MDNLTERQPLDRGGVADLMTRVLDRGDQSGWNREGADFTVFVVYELADVVTTSTLEEVMQSMGPPVHAGRYGAQPLLGQKMFTPERVERMGSAADAFYNFAMNIAFADPVKVAAATGTQSVAGMRVILSQPGILGFASVNEAWGFEKMDPLIASLIKTGMPARNIKGSRQSRMSYAGDVTGHVHHANRWRGDTQVQVRHGVHECNQVTVGLRMLADVAAGTVLPASEEEFAAHYHGTCGQDADDEG